MSKFKESKPNIYLMLYCFTVLIDKGVSNTVTGKFGGCPSLTINEYSSVREDLIQDDDPNLRVPMIVPADPKRLLYANCTNFEKMSSAVHRTSAPGLKLQLIFDPLNSDSSELSFQIILTAFVLGPSFNCPSGTFRCWDDRSRCISEGVTCDGVDNCLDGSDENNYLLAFLCLILLVTMVVFILRKRMVKRKEEEQTWVDMTIRQHTAVQKPLLPRESSIPKEV